MKIMLFCLVLSIVLSNRVSAAEPESNIGEIMGEQVQLLVKLKKASIKGDYSAIYDFLDPEYTKVVKKETFVGVSQARSWKILNLGVGTAMQFKAIAYVPVTAEVVAGKTREEIHAVVFFAKGSDNKWRLINFPFALPDIPDFGLIPKWFEGTPTSQP